MEFLKDLPQTSELQIASFISGYFYSDGGAAMGVLPKAIWQKKISADSANRIKTALRHLLINVNGKKVLIDTGVGNTYSEKEKKIFKPTEYQMFKKLAGMGVSRFDIDYVIFTHLHFDHLGGVAANFDGQKELSFPNAVHIIQEDEWKIANNPDELNKAAYTLQENLQILQERGRIHLFQKSMTIEKQIEVFKVGGHSVGSSAIMIDIDGKKWCYAGDIIANSFLLSLPVTSAYDISRRETFQAKQKIMQEADLIVFNHDNDFVGVSI